MADESGKPPSPTSIAAPTAEIDDDWALDDAPAPSATPKPIVPSSMAAKPAAEQAPSPAVIASSPIIINTQPTQDESASTSGTPATEEIDSDWPEDAAPSSESLKRPRIPAAAKVPAEASSVDQRLAPITAERRGLAASPSTTSEPPESASTVAQFEAAATAASRRAFGMGASSVPPARESSPSISPANTASSPAPASLGPSQNDSQAPSEAKPSKKGGLVLLLAAAAVAVVGIGVAASRSTTPERKVEREEKALQPDPVNSESTPKAEPEVPQPAVPEPEAAASAAPATSSDTPAADAGATADEGKQESDADAPGGVVRTKVNIYPPEAQIYHKGKLLGLSGTEIDVKPGERMLLVLILDGYWPRKLILDGKETTYNIGLRKQPASKFLPGTSSSAAPGAAP